MNEYTVICTCHHREHQFTIWYDDDLDFLGFSMHLSAHGFLRRLWTAIRYIFGYRSRYGDWDDVLVERDEAVRIRDFIERYLDS